jgi:hypothetical protein
MRTCSICLSASGLFHLGVTPLNQQEIKSCWVSVLNLPQLSSTATPVEAFVIFHLHHFWPSRSPLPTFSTGAKAYHLICTADHLILCLRPPQCAHTPYPVESPQQGTPPPCSHPAYSSNSGGLLHTVHLPFGMPPSPQHFILICWFHSGITTQLPYLSTSLLAYIKCLLHLIPPASKSPL